jgi:serine protease Do
MKCSFATLASLLLLAGSLPGCSAPRIALPALAQDVSERPNFAGRSPRMVNLDSLNLDVPVGSSIGEAKFGWTGSCRSPRPLTYKHGSVKLATATYLGMFKDVMQAAGIPVEQPARFSGEEVKKADLNFAATIQEMTLDICFPEVGKDKDHAIGEAYVKVEWSVFSPVERKVVYSATTQGRSPPNFETRLADDGIITEALRDSLGRLLTQPGFDAAITTTPTTTVAAASAP